MYAESSRGFTENKHALVTL